MYDTEQPSGMAMPDEYATHAVWMAYAIGRGMDPEEARGRTRDQLRVAFLPEGPLIGSVPYLERHDQDPDAIAARREARRKPWERP
jgi:hypothetical protein